MLGMGFGFEESKICLEALLFMCMLYIRYTGILVAKLNVGIVET